MKAIAPRQIAILAAIAASLLFACSAPEEAATAPAAAAADPAQTPSDESATIFTRNFRAIGTDPYWAAHVTDGRLRYMTPEDQEGVTVDAKQISPADQRDSIELSGMIGDVPFTLSGRIEPCTDGLSDREYPYSVTFERDGESMTGCARPTDSL
ncbi:hypothetical protein [Croceicoccus hydrothermalis]|uniref:hypothetical protein n=1 Tax=Croceicoccus hydrothermalis TaxID=2867964 RepID=UPI001EFB0DE5|nr:hypothetical protein [Croceicoccus hydrothermalis]